MLELKRKLEYNTFVWKIIETLWRYAFKSFGDTAGTELRGQHTLRILQDTACEMVQSMKHKSKYRSASAALLLSALVLSGCQSKSHEESLTPGEDSNPVTSAPTAGAQGSESGTKNEDSDKPALTSSPTPSPTPVLDFEEAWKYQGVQKGYYNAAAE